MFNANNPVNLYDPDGRRTHGAPENWQILDYINELNRQMREASMRDMDGGGSDVWVTKTTYEVTKIDKDGNEKKEYVTVVSQSYGLLACSGAESRIMMQIILGKGNANYFIKTAPGISSFAGILGAAWRGARNLGELGKFASTFGIVVSVGSSLGEVSMIGNKYGWEGIYKRYDFQMALFPTMVGITLGSLTGGPLTPIGGFLIGAAGYYGTVAIINSQWNKLLFEGTIFDSKGW